MSLSAAAAKPLGSRLTRLQQIGLLQKPRLTASYLPGGSGNPYWISDGSGASSVGSPLMLGQIIGASARARNSGGVGRRRTISVSVAAFMLASVFSVGQGPAAMADEVPVDENSGMLGLLCTGLYSMAVGYHLTFYVDALYSAAFQQQYLLHAYH